MDILGALEMGATGWIGNVCYCIADGRRGCIPRERVSGGYKITKNKIIDLDCKMFLM